MASRDRTRTSGRDLLDQYLPVQVDHCRRAGLKFNPTLLIIDHITDVLRRYDQTCLPAKQSHN